MVIWFEILNCTFKKSLPGFQEMVNLCVIGGKTLGLLTTRKKDFSRQLF